METTEEEDREMHSEWRDGLIDKKKELLDERKYLTQKRVDKNKQKNIAKKELDKEKNKRSPASKKMKAAVEDVMRKYGIDRAAYHGGDLTGNPITRFCYQANHIFRL